MPFKSASQARYMYSQLPKLAAKWQSESPVKVGSLPDKVATPSTKKSLSGR